MGKFLHDTVLDQSPNYIDANITALHVNTSQPADRAAAIADSLATAAMTGADVAIANGDVSGRKATISQKSNISITASGTATHVSLITSSILAAVTTCTSQGLTSGGTVTVPAWDIEFLDAA